MTSHLLYEGSQLERVLERVRSDHGPAAAIVSADRVRKGGMGGFFAKELFRVTVAVPDEGDELTSAEVEPAALLASGSVARPATSVPALGSAAPAPASAPVSAGSAALAPVSAGSGVTLGRIGDGVEASDLELWGIVDTGIVGASSAQPRAGEAFAAALEAALEEQPEVELEPEGPRVVSGLVRHDPPLPVGSRHLVAATDLVDHHADRCGDADDLDQPVGARSMVPLVGGLVTSTLDGPRPASDAVARVVELRPHRVRRETGAGADLGRLLGELERGWVDPPALADDGLVVIVGAADEARRVATMAAEVLGIAGRDVVVAAPARPEAGLGADELDRLRSAVVGRGPRLLVVEVVPGREGHDWARAAIVGLEAAQVRLALSAERPAGALQLTATALGGADVVDVIDLLDVGAATAPAELLDLDVAVATLDGRTVSPALWAATLVASVRGGADGVRIDRPAAIAR